MYSLITNLGVSVYPEDFTLLLKVSGLSVTPVSDLPVSIVQIKLMLSTISIVHAWTALTIADSL